MNRIAILVWLTAGALAGCSSDGGNEASGGSSGSGGSGAAAGSTSGGTGGAGATGGAGGSAGGVGGSGGSTPQCADGPGYATNPTPSRVDQVLAKVVNPQGAPVADLLAQVCGTDFCVNGKTDATGAVVTCQSGGQICTPGINPGQDMTLPAFKYGAGLNFVKFAYPLPSGTTQFDLGTLAIVPLGPPGSGQTLTSGATVTSNEVELTLAENTAVKIDQLTYLTEDEQQFRAVVFDPADAPDAVDPSLNLELLVGTTPIETEFCPAATLSLPNSKGWAADADVEFFVHGVSIEEEWAPYAGWAKVSDGKVSSDGTKVVTNDGEGIPHLSVIGVRLKP
ncbi:MAG: hypothetical protein H6718_02105 [Polyangiaceae bacterium]|nr:hypothetical protein [Polyangiaceae bacterium]MCB9608682.1 hypothetical protein [Polyangiaceae bacterium]